MSNAICIPKAALFPSEIDATLKDVYVTDFRRLLDVQPTLEDRATCETDDTLLQIIPYITLFDSKTKEIFIYQRGKASGESRLSGKCSIGLGGHMEVEDTSMPLAEMIVLEAARELNEEIGLPITSELESTLRQKLVSGNFGMMYNTRTDVDKKHLAIAFFMAVDKDVIMSTPHEDDVITRGQWMGISEIFAAVDSESLEIEQWTRMVLQSLKMAWKD